MPELLDHVVTGALYDFLGYLTSQPVPVVLSSGHEPGPALEHLQHFLSIRGVDQNCEPMVKDWQSRCSQLAGCTQRIV